MAPGHGCEGPWLHTRQAQQAAATVFPCFIPDKVLPSGLVASKGHCLAPGAQETHLSSHHGVTRCRGLCTVLLLQAC